MYAIRSYPQLRRLDSALAACSGRTATTKAMGKGSTQFQHLKHTELPTSVLEGWLEEWKENFDIHEAIQVRLSPHKPGSTVMELSLSMNDEIVANMVFSTMTDRNKRQILSIRDQNTFTIDLRQKRLMTLMHLFVTNRYKSDTVYYLTPTEENAMQCAAMQKMGIYTRYSDEVGHIIVADVHLDNVKSYLDSAEAVTHLINKKTALELAEA